MKKSTIVSRQLQLPDQSGSDSGIVQYSFFQQHTIELIFSNMTTCQWESSPVTINPQGLKKMVIENLELFGLLVVIFYVLSIMIIVKQVRRRNQIYLDARCRKDSQTEETHLSNNSRKQSQEGSQERANSLSNPVSQNNDQGQVLQTSYFHQFDQNHQIDTNIPNQKSSSTTSSPGLLKDQESGDGNSSTKIKQQQQLVPFTPTKQVDCFSENHIQSRNSIDSGLGRLQEMVQIQGTNIRVKKEIRVEVEKDPETQILRKIETQTIVTEIQATEETEEQLKCMEERFQIQVSEDKQRKGSKQQLNNPNKQAFRGLRMIEEENFIKGTTFKQLDVVTDWSKNCENGKFKKLFSSHELLGKGTYGEVYRALKLLDQTYYAIKRIFFSVISETNLFEHPVFDEVKSLQSLNHCNILRYHTCWTEELEVEMMMRLNLLQLQDDRKRSRKNSRIQSFNRQSSINENDIHNDSNNEFIQFVGDEVNSLKFATKSKIDTQKGLIDTQKGSQQSFHPSDYSSSMESFVKRLQFNPAKSAPIFGLYIETEYCEKQTLKDFIDTVDRQQSILLIKNIFLQIAQGLAYIHDKELIHRDLKPANIFLTSNNVPKIGDFGLSTDYDNNEEMSFNKTTNSKSNKTASTGTPLYMAPEVRDGEQYGPKADVYALGMIYFELLNKMKTNHERIKLIKELTINKLLPSTFLKQFPEESKLIIRMTSQKAENRPSSQQIAQLLLNVTLVI